MVNFDVLLIVHVLCGGISLLLGLSIMIQRKGGRLHKLVGIIYYYSMLISSFTAMPMSWMHRNYFLLMVSVLTAFMLLSGRRYIRRKKAADAGVFDWTLTSIMAIAGISFVVFAVKNLTHGNTFGIVYLIFGMGGLFFVFQDFRNFTKRSPISNFWLTTHLQRMIGSYVAALTAFLVVNNNILPGTIAWVVPTIILVPLILIWTRKYRVLKSPRREKLPDNIVAG